MAYSAHRPPGYKGRGDSHLPQLVRQVRRTLSETQQDLAYDWVLYPALIDGLYSGKHPMDQAPRKWNSPPFNWRWTSSLLASQDPIAIDSVGFDFLWTEWEDFPRRPGVDDYLHEAALAHSPSSGTFYDPDHPSPTKRLASLGVHEHWNNAKEKKYSRNLGTGDGIELVAVTSGGTSKFRKTGNLLTALDTGRTRDED